MSIIEGAIARDALRQTIIDGGAAGPLTVTGIKTSDQLVAVLDVTNTADLTDEFTVSAADTIDNTDGTATTGASLIVTYLAVN